MNLLDERWQTEVTIGIGMAMNSLFEVAHRSKFVALNKVSTLWKDFLKGPKKILTKSNANYYGLTPEPTE